jgi:hypothetical protein
VGGHRDHQRLPGYCLLLHDGEADHLTDLARPRRTVVLEDLALLGEAVMLAPRDRRATKPGIDGSL